MKKCPYCSEEIQDTAVKRRYCGEWLEKQESASNLNASNETPHIKRSSLSKSELSSMHNDLSSNQSSIITHYAEKINLKEEIYAGFWKRALASIIDIFVLVIVLLILSLSILIPIRKKQYDRAFAICYIVRIVNAWPHNDLMERSHKQGTIGKMVLGIKVTDLNGNKTDFVNSYGRYFGNTLAEFGVC